MRHENEKTGLKHSRHVSDKVKYTKSYKVVLFFRWLIKFIGLSLAVLLAVISTYIGFFAPINNNYTIIIPDKEDIKIEKTVFVTDSEDSFLTRLREATVGPKELYIGEIIAGPYGIIKKENNKLIVDDNGQIYQTKVNLDDHSKFLDEEYIVKCVSGNCEIDTEFIVKASQIKGEVQKEIDLREFMKN